MAKKPNPFAKGGMTPKGQTKAVAAKGFMPGKKGVNPFAKGKAVAVAKVKDKDRDGV